MKKRLFFFLGLSLFAVLTFISCNSDDNDDPSFLGAKVNVTVKNSLGELQKGTTVYMFKDASGDTPDGAKKQVVTNENGIAIFDLNLTELNILESQTSLYFVVFYQIGDETFKAGSEGVTVKRNETRSLEITIPL